MLLPSSDDPTGALSEFMLALEELIAREPSPHRVTDAVSARLARLLAAGQADATLLATLLAPQFRASSPDAYQTHLIAVSPSRRFSLLSLVWLPGQVTTIHDHICWCVVGVLQGVEREQRFSLRAEANGARWLAPLTEETLTLGNVSVLVPPDENIHRVANAGEQLAISLHVYGADIGVMGSSINQRFDDLPIRRDAVGGQPVQWRRVG